MPGLNLQEEASSLPDVSVVRVAGSLDTATLPHFEGFLKRMRESGRVKVVVDLAQMDYISSSGLGSFLGTVDPFRRKGGDLVFIHLSERVKKIFKVVGFMRLLTLMPDEAEALRYFEGRSAGLRQLVLAPATATPHSGEAFEIEIMAADDRGMVVEGFQGEATLRTSGGIVSPSKVGPFQQGVWRGKVILTGPGRTGLKASSSGAGGSEAAGEVVLEIVETMAPAALPFEVGCPGCGLKTEIHAFNVYRCRDCDEIYFVDKWAHAISLKTGTRGVPPPPKNVSLSFPADVNLLGAVRSFLTAVLREHGYPLEVVNDLELASDEAVTNVVEHAYQYDTHKTVHVDVVMEKRRILIRIKDQGQAFNPLLSSPVNLDQHIAERRTGGLGMHLMQTLTDSVDYRREEGFNVLTLTKNSESKL
jgi:serine/threonine-protein kinase RsbW